MVPDVKKDPRYLPTFWNTESEIVVPIMDENKNASAESSTRRAKSSTRSPRTTGIFSNMPRCFWRGPSAARKSTMPPPVERALAAWLAAGTRGIGQILIASRNGAFFSLSSGG